MSKTKVQYCSKCKRTYEKEITWKSRTLFLMTRFLICFVLINAVFGGAGFYNFIVGEVYDNPDLLVSIGGMSSFMINLKDNFQSQAERDSLREIALNLSRGCEEDRCKAVKIFLHLLSFKYENGESHNPLKIWEEKEGDCDEMSYLYHSLLKSLDIKSRVMCSATHCWVIIKLENQKIMADITKYDWVENV